MITNEIGFDAVTVDNIPRDARVVFAYVCGAYANVEAVKARCPHARLITICVDAAHVADMLDTERGAATVEDGPQWVRWMRHLNRRPVLYLSKSVLGASEQVFTKASVPVPFYGVADWTNAPHVVVGSVGTQWANGTPQYPGLAPGCDTWTITPNWPERYQQKGKAPVIKKLPTKAQLLSGLGLAASAIAAVIAIGNQLHLPTAVRSVLAAASALILIAERYIADPSTGNPPPPKA